MQFKNPQVPNIPSGSGSNNVDARWDVHKECATEAGIQAWLASYLVELLEIDLDEVDITISFERYGLDSSAAVGLIGDLADWLECELEPTLPYDYPSIKALARYLAEKSKVKA